MTDSAPIYIQYAPEDVEAILEQRLKFVTSAWGAATAYDTAVTVAGYGAFFGLWAGIAKDITPVARTSSAALMAMSLTTYILWHIVLMFARHRHDTEFAKVLSVPAEPAETLLAWDAVELKSQRTLTSIQHRLWRPIFGLSLVTGMGAAVVLTYNATAVALDLPQLTGRW